MKFRAMFSIVVSFGATSLLMACGGKAGGSSGEASASDNNTRYAFVANYIDNSISCYAANISDGHIEQVGRAGAGMHPIAVAVAPSRRYVYAVNSGSGSVSQYAIGTIGNLTPLTTAMVDAGIGSISIAISPSARYVYVANSGSNNISQYLIGSDGTLIPMASANVNAGDEPHDIAVSPAGRNVYVANYISNDISQYSIGSDGSLTPMATPRVAAGKPHLDDYRSHG